MENKIYLLIMMISYKAGRWFWMKKFKVGVIGLGLRGAWWACEMLTALPYVEITALCDLYEDRLEKSAAAIRERPGRKFRC